MKLLPAIAWVETRSYYDEREFIYRDRRDGAAGERGPYQISKIACKQVSGDWLHMRDPKVCETACINYCRYLLKATKAEDLYTLAGHYNGGPRRCNKDYILKIRKYYERVENAKNNIESYTNP